jgi:signal transduction histidine kinase/ActR/RegA family two-component response regulator
MNFSFLKARFHTKVLVPVVAVMMLLMVVTMYVVNQRLKRQSQKEADDALKTASAVFKSSQKERQRTLQVQLRNIPNAPQYRATFARTDAATIQDMLDKNPLDFEGDLIVYKTIEGKTIAMSRRDASLDMAEFEKNSEACVRQALEGMPSVDVIRVSDRLFDIVSFPVTMPVSGEVIGAVTFCITFGKPEAQKLSASTGCGIVLIANNQIVASSLQRQDLLQQCIDRFDSVADPLRRTRAADHDVREIVVPEEHFLWRAEKFESLNGDPKVGYVLLFSNAAALGELRATQQTIIVVSAVGILFATAVVWFLVRNTTRPLRQLRDSAEAVGRGDFTRRVHASSHDECGELANVFNHMTENLQAAREKLEQTVTRLENTQAQLIQSEKLSAIGEFVAGVTHELNNPLTSLLGFSELLQQTNVDERQKRFVDRIAGSARRCQKIVQGLLSFARQHEPERKVANLNELVEAVVEILAYEMRTSNIEVIPQLEPDLPPVLVDSHQIQQVLLNLMNNARQAMDGYQREGKLRVRTEAYHGRVRVTVSDNGPGITEENLKKIFDPFFTTKEAGKGTGLGLSLSYGIIHEHGGTIRAESKPGTGATFIIELPAHHAHAEPARDNDVSQNKNSSAPGSGKQVLVIDDEEAILDFVAEVLSADGYRVDTASDGEAALRHLRQKRYDLALCDWKMPGLNGQNLFERVQKEDPGTARRFVFMTGDVINEQIEAFLRQHRKTCLSKPFSITDFRSVLADLPQAA